LLLQVPVLPHPEVIAALFTLVAKAAPDKELPELQKFGGTVYQTSLSTKDEEELKKTLEHDQVSTSADEMLEPQ
jgi:uncharacterized membrane protein